MSMKLGEVLVQKGLVTERQLRAALDIQLAYGGHLGTCLVELGLVDLDCLGRVLAEKFSIGYADREKILCIESHIVATLSPALVKKHLAIPFQMRDRALHIAMVDPGNLLALDELSFATGLRLEAWIAPELLIHRAMEHYYDIPRQLRHFTVSARLGEPVLPSPAAQDAPASAPNPAAAGEPAKERSVDDGGFVVVTRPRIAELPAPPAGIDGPHPRNGRMAVQWIKFKRGERYQWSDLFAVPLEHGHFDDLAGVYVIWHNGVNPVLRVGQGYIRTELRSQRLDPRMTSARRESPLFVTWTPIPREHRDGMERYLIETLNPQFVTDPPETLAIEVNLPR